MTFQRMTPHLLAPDFSSSVATNLTRNQLLIWVGQKQNSEAPLYNMIKTFTFEHGLDIAAFHQGFQALIAQTDILRTTIVEFEGGPQQVVLDSFPYSLDCVSFSENGTAAAQYQAWLDERCARLFALDRCLFDSALVQLDGHTVWYLNLHHIVSDAATFQVLYDRMASLYRSALNRDTAALEARVTPQFSAYVLHEQQVRQTKRYEEATKHWRQAALIESEPLEFYGKRVVSEEPRTERLSFQFGLERTAKLHALAGEKGVRLFSRDLTRLNLFTALYAAFVSRLTQVEQFNVGMPFHNRATLEQRETAGLLIEIGLLPIDIDEKMTLRSLIEAVSEQTFAGLRHVQPGVSEASHNRAYEVLLNYITVQYSDFAGMWPTADWLHTGYGDGHHAIRAQVHNFMSADQYSIDFDFKRDLFTAEQQKQAVEQFLLLCDTLLEAPDQPIHQTSLLTQGQHRKSVVDFNDTAREYPQEGTAVSLFEAQVARTPEATAVVCQDVFLSYRELNRHANQIAHLLSQNGVSRGSFVAIALPHSIEMVIALWGILKAGAAYIPLDLSHPDKRLHATLEELKTENSTPFLLTHSPLEGRFATADCSILAVDRLLQDESTAIQAENPIPAAGPQDLAYLIFTSGSTGKPKGALIEHGGLVNYIWWAKEQYTKGDALTFPLYSSLAFDLTVTSIYVPLISGGTIVVYPQQNDTHDSVLPLIFADEQIDIVKLTPAHLALLKHIDVSQSRARCLIVGGEDFKTLLARDTMTHFGRPIEIFNEYGPTEAVVGCMVHRFDPDEDNGLSVPIGRPAANKQIYILDHYGNPVPPEVIGEICVSGVGIARGYLKRPELTQARFVPDPFRPGQTMYRTGDIARWLPSGMIEFLGRRDHQVKIRSARIELGEIEHALLTHEQVGACVVHVVPPAKPTAGVPDAEVRHCGRCGLPSNYPDVTFDHDDICGLCRSYDTYRDKVTAFFKPYDALLAIAENAKQTRRGDHDCIVLLSGGKDSTYMLYQLAEMGLKILAFTLDNGFISDGAKKNINQTVAHLGIDHVYGQTPAMNKIFVDSLQRFSNVCNGCFKTIYTLSISLAKEKGIGYIFTGLSRGQFFETRLSSDVFLTDDFDPAEFDQAIIAARKAYHRLPDAVNQNLDTRVFAEDDLFEQVQVVDFYRYNAADLDEIYRFMAVHTPWLRPSDTGRSTNCLINDAGIFVHKQREKYHNYALPYSWDVRLGHKKRAAALEELDDEIDEEAVQKILSEIGYTDAVSTADHLLVAYYTASQELTINDLQAHLKQTLPDYMIPSHFVRLDVIPLTSNGKIDRDALPSPDDQRPHMEAHYVMPQTEVEINLTRIWSEVLSIAQIGIHDDFFELGGDSITNFQVISRAQKVGIRIHPTHIFKHHTVAELAAVVETAPIDQPERITVVGKVPLSPIQHWFFAQNFANPSHWNQTIRLQIQGTADLNGLTEALNGLVTHHDMLRASFRQENGVWTQRLLKQVAPLVVRYDDLSALPAAEQSSRLEEIAGQIQTELDLEAGRLVQAAVVIDGGERQTQTLVIAIHHLVVDAVSWLILIDDLESAYRQRLAGRPVQLPAKTTHFKRWTQTLEQYAQSEASWLLETGPPKNLTSVEGENLEADTIVLNGWLDVEKSHALLHEIHAAYNTQIGDVLLAALGQALMGWSGDDRVTIDVEGHGRENIDPNLDLSRTVGWFTSVFPLTISSNPRPEEVLKATKERLRQLPHNGLDYGVLHYLAPPERQIAKQHAETSFNYLGSADQSNRAESCFSVSDPLNVSFCDSATRPHLFKIDSFITGGRLQVSWRYNTRLHDSQMMKGLLERYLAEIEQLIAHCLAQTNRQYTPSDFADASLGQDELDDILAEFGDF